MSQSSGPTPCQRVTRDVSVKLSKGDYVVLPSGAIVKSLNPKYLPADHPFRETDPENQSVAYTQYGIALIPSEYLVTIY